MEYLAAAAYPLATGVTSTSHEGQEQHRHAVTEGHAGGEILDATVGGDRRTAEDVAGHRDDRRPILADRLDQGQIVTARAQLEDSTTQEASHRHHYQHLDPSYPHPSPHTPAANHILHDQSTTTLSPYTPTLYPPATADADSTPADDDYNGMPPPPPLSYPTLPALLAACQDHARRYGYACVTSSNNYKRGIAYVRCDRGGEYVNHWNVTPETRVRKNRTRRLVGCKWKARAKRVGESGDWELTMMHDRHTGHGPSADLASHPSLRQLPPEAVAAARAAFLEKKTPKEVLEALREYNDAVTAQDVYNLKAKVRKELGAGPLAIGSTGKRIKRTKVEEQTSAANEQEASPIPQQQQQQNARPRQGQRQQQTRVPRSRNIRTGNDTQADDGTVDPLLRNHSHHATGNLSHLQAAVAQMSAQVEGGKDPHKDLHRDDQNHMEQGQDMSGFGLESSMNEHGGEHDKCECTCCDH